MLPLIADNFSGGGGASTGITMALNRKVDIAINHNAKALIMHKANHPSTTHFTEDVFDVDPLTATKGRPVGLAWFSPDCTHFSHAKGGKPLSQGIRGLAEVTIPWAELTRPSTIVLENVKEFVTWGPLDEDNHPIKARAGELFNKFVSKLKSLGYSVNYRIMRACNYGAPTSRERLFLIAKADGSPAIWPAATHGSGLIPYRTAAECIDWSIPIESVFERKKPLVEKTMARIAKGISKFVLTPDNQYIVPAPIPSIGTGHPALAAAFIAKHFGGRGTSGSSVAAPLGTITTVDHNALVLATLVREFGTGGGVDINAPIPTIMPGGGGKTRLVQAFLIKYYGTGTAVSLNAPAPTITTRDNLGLVTVNSESYIITDILMRMLQPRELFKAQGFPDDYVIDPLRPDGKPLTKTTQVRMVGNSVSPIHAAAIVRANCPELIVH